jgi:hypothetical protein
MEVKKGVNLYSFAARFTALTVFAIVRGRPPRKALRISVAASDLPFTFKILGDRQFSGQ